MEQEKKKLSPGGKKVCIGCGSLLGLIIVIIVLSIIFAGGTPTFDKVKSPTNQPSITLSASNSYKNAKIELYQNGVKNQEIKSDSSGKFTAKVDLIEGDNKFKATATNGKGKSRTSLEINIVYDKTPPILTLSQTQFETPSNKAEISGETEKNSIITLWDNDIKKDTTQTFTGGGKFIFSVTGLKNGENKFIIKVEDEAGNIGEQKEVVITYTPPAEVTKTTDIPASAPVSTPTPSPTPTPTIAPTTPAQKYPSLYSWDATMDKDLYLSCAGGDYVNLWTEPTDSGESVLRDRVPCGTLSWAFNKYDNVALGVTFYAVNTNDKRVKNAAGWLTEDLIIWK